MENVSQSIYQFAYAKGNAVIAPKRHWRKALNAPLVDRRSMVEVMEAMEEQSGDTDS